MKPHLIVNPASANGRTGRHFDAIARAVRASLGDYECLFTRRKGDGAVLARQVVKGGADLLVAVGGDGTASEVIDGLMEHGRPINPEAVFGYIPRGTGGDLRRTLGFSQDPGQAARELASGALRVCDLGRIELLGHDGLMQVRHFANVAGFGVAGLVVKEVESSSKALGGKLSFMIASGKALARWRDQPVRWRVDGGPWKEERVTSFSVCNGRFFGGGMMVAPSARVDDGLFSITIWKGLGLSDFVFKKGMLYDGTHVRLPNTRCLEARVVEAEPLDGARVLIDVDGEQPGMLPARFTMLPGALRVRVGAA